MFQWLSNTWADFEAWVHSWFPGFKTQFVNALGVIGMGAASAYDYIVGLPETKWLSKEALTIVGAVLFTLSFWFKGMGDRVDAREEAI